MMDITEQTEFEKQAVIRTNMRTAIKRVLDLRGQSDSIVKQLKSGVDSETIKAACGEEWHAFKEAIEQL